MCACAPFLCTCMYATVLDTCQCIPMLCLWACCASAWVFFYKAAGAPGQAVARRRVRQLHMAGKGKSQRAGSGQPADRHGAILSQRLPTAHFMSRNSVQWRTGHKQDVCTTRIKKKRTLAININSYKATERLATCLLKHQSNADLTLPQSLSQYLLRLMSIRFT